MIEREVIGPYLVRTGRRLRSQPSSSDPLLWPLARQLQAGGPPQPICSARAHAVAVAPEKDADAAIAASRILRRQLLHLLDHGRVLCCLATLVAQCRSRHLKQRAGPPRRETMLPAIRNRPPTGRHAHQFFAATSFMTSISRSSSPISFFSRAFSASSLLQAPDLVRLKATETLAPCVDRLLADV
jgi:hypothetical protein